MNCQPSGSMHVVLVVVLVALAGCSGVFGPNGASSSPSAGSVTPVPFSTAGGSEPGPGTTGEYPAGVGPEGMTNVSALVAAHRNLLENQSYTVARTSNRTSRSNPDYVYLIEDERTIMRYLQPNGSARIGIEYVGPAGTAHRDFVERTGGVSRGTGSPDRGEIRNPDGVFWGLVEPQYRLGSLGDDTRVTRVDRDGHAFYRLADGRTTVYVRADGLIKTIVTGSGPLEERFSYRDVGNTTVPVPEWVRRATRPRTATHTHASTRNRTASPAS